MNERKERLYLEDLGTALRWTGSTFSIFIKKWFYYIPRVKLTLIEGYHETAEKAEEAIIKSKLGERTIGFPEDYPKNFEIVCRPEDLLRFAKLIQNVCSSQTNSD